MTEKTASTPLPNPKRVLVIHNPVAGARRYHFYVEVVTRLRDAGFEVDERSTERRGDAEVFARTLDVDAYDILAVAGGDGTINEALNGLVAHPKGPDSVSFGIIPLGTANVLALEIGLELTAYRVASTLIAGRTREVYPGHLNDRVFLLMAGVGFDAHVVEGVSSPLKRRFGKGAYALISLQKMLSFRFPGYQISINGEVIDAASVVVSKGRHYAGPYIAAPDANLAEPSFDVCIFEKPGAFHTARYAINMLMGRLYKSAGYRIVRTSSLRIEGPPGDPVQGDGDIVTHLPADIAIGSERVSLLVPA